LVTAPTDAGLADDTSPRSEVNSPRRHVLSMPNFTGRRCSSGRLEQLRIICDYISTALRTATRGTGT
jgi:hypothetical protein